MDLRDKLDAELSPAVRDYSTEEYNDLLDRLVALCHPSSSNAIVEIVGAARTLVSSVDRLKAALRPFKPKS